MGAPDRMLHPLVAEPSTPLRAPEALAHVGDGEGVGRRPACSLAAWRALRDWLNSLPVNDALRDEWRRGIDEVLARAVVFERLSGGRWRVGQGSSSGVYGNAPETVAIAYEALRRGEAQFAGITDDAMRNRLHRGLANWAERVNAPLLAERFRRFKVQAGRVIDPYAAYTCATLAA